MSDEQKPAQRIFHGLKECSSATGVPVELLLLARAHPQSPKGTEGFHASGRIYFDPLLGPWIESNKEILESVSGETREHWLTRRDRANALLSELELEEKYKQIVNRAQVNDLLERLSASLVSLFNSRLRQELPARLNLPAEKISEIDKVIAELFAIVQKSIEAWK